MATLRYPYSFVISERGMMYGSIMAPFRARISKINMSQQRRTQHVSNEIINHCCLTHNHCWISLFGVWKFWCLVLDYTLQHYTMLYYPPKNMYIYIEWGWYGLYHAHNFQVSDVVSISLGVTMIPRPDLPPSTRFRAESKMIPPTPKPIIL